MSYESSLRQVASLPAEIGQQLTTLQTLDLSGCSWLESLPAEIGLTALQTLDLSGCEKLRSLPAAIGQLTALQIIGR